jgi:hypothetical protein
MAVAAAGHSIVVAVVDNLPPTLRFGRSLLTRTDRGIPSTREISADSSEDVVLAIQSTRMVCAAT